MKKRFSVVLLGLFMPIVFLSACGSKQGGHVDLPSASDRVALVKVEIRRDNSMTDEDAVALAENVKAAIGTRLKDAGVQLAAPGEPFNVTLEIRDEYRANQATVHRPYGNSNVVKSVLELFVTGVSAINKAAQADGDRTLGIISTTSQESTNSTEKVVFDRSRPDFSSADPGAVKNWYAKAGDDLADAYLKLQH